MSQLVRHRAAIGRAAENRQNWNFTDALFQLCTIVKESVSSSSLNFDKKICKSESEGTCEKQLHFWNTLLLLSSLVLSLHFPFEQMEYICNSFDFEAVFWAFQFFVVGILAFYIRWLVEEELRKIGAFDGRRMSEYAQCCPPCQETQEIFWKIRFDIWRQCLSLRCASR